jgi:GT2 family glycosyltransferase
VTPPADLGLSVVVCCYTEERAPLLARAVASLRNQTRPVDEIIVVVDHNPALQRALERTLGDAVIVANGESKGLAGARNTGLRVAAGDVVAFLDDDARAEPEWAEHLMAPYADPHVVAVGGAVVPEFEAGRPAWFPHELDWIVGCTYEGHRRDAGPVRNLIGANMSVRAAVLHSLGGFRTDLGRVAGTAGGCEETELCIRAGRTPGAEIRFEPAAVVQHFVPAERTTWRYVRRRCFDEGRSKATVRRLVGAGEALGTERSYVARTLRSAIGRDLAASVRHRDAAAAERALACAAAPVIAAVGYAAATASRRRRNPSLPSQSGTLDEPVGERGEHPGDHGDEEQVHQEAT